MQPQPCPTVHLQHAVAASHSALVFAEQPQAAVVGQLLDPDVVVVFDVLLLFFLQDKVREMATVVAKKTQAIKGRCFFMMIKIK